MCLIKKTALLGVALLMLSACGQRGPLYLPSNQPDASQPAKETSEQDATEQNSAAQNNQQQSAERSLSSNLHDPEQVSEIPSQSLATEEARGQQ